MRVRYNESTMKSKRLRRNASWLCLLTCVGVLGLTARLEEHKTYAQDSPIPSTSTGQIGISPEQPVPRPQPIIVKGAPPSETNSSTKSNPEPSPKADADAGQGAGEKPRQDAGAQSDQNAEAPKATMPAVPDPDPNNPVAVQSASLLKMAYDLKSEVDKTTKDTLSVAVVRRAAEIEQLARKMRAK